MLSRRLARPLLAAVFVADTIDALRDPGPRAEAAAPLARPLARQLNLPDDPAQVVKATAAVQLVAGLLLAMNRLPRLAATVLAVTMVPTALGLHRFWEEEDEEERARQQQLFLKDVGLLGGLVLAARDLEGSPSLGWWARRAAARTRAAAAEAAVSARHVVPG